MLSEQDKQAILNGVSAKTRQGMKAIYVGIADYDNNLKYGFIIYKNDRIFCYTQLNNEMCLYNNKERDFDIVGLWEDKNEPEPFNLERALSGEPVMLKNGLKAYVKFKLPQTSSKIPYIGYYINKNENCVEIAWDEHGMCEPVTNHETVLDIIGMWQEPKRPTVTLTLPCPLKQPQEGMWLIGNNFDLVHPHPINIRNQKPETMQLIDEAINNGRAFATKEDAIAWIDALSNSRR